MLPGVGGAFPGEAGSGFLLWGERGHQSLVDLVSDAFTCVAAPTDT